MNAENFYHQPRRLSPLGYIVNILYTLGKIIKQSIFVLIYIGYKNRDFFYSAYFWGLVLIVLLIIAVISYFNFKSFTYEMDDEAEEFVVKKGIFNKSKIVIKYSNILQVNISQNLLQKVLSVYGLTLDTAGSDKVEVNLYALDGFHAKSLKDILLKKIGKEKNELSSENESFDIPFFSEDILKLSSKNLILVSLFSNYRQGLALFIAFVISMLQNFTDVMESFDINGLNNFEYSQLLEFYFLSILSILVFTIVFIPFVINIFRYFFKYYDFTIVKNANENFSMQYGLIKKVNTIFNKDKVQLIVFRQNKLLKKFGIGILSLKQLVADNAKADQVSIDIPGITDLDRDKVYNLAFDEDLTLDQNIIKPSIRFFINKFIKMSVIYVLLGILAIIVDYYLNASLFILAVCFLLNTIYYYLLFSNYYLVVNDNFISKRYGVWNDKEIIVSIEKIQSISLSQSIIQKWSNTSNLAISTAAMSLSFNFFDSVLLTDLSNKILYNIEKDNKKFGKTI